MGLSQCAYRPVLLFLGFLSLGLTPPVRGQAVPVGEEFQVNTYTTGFQGISAVSSDGDGDFVVVWQSRRNSAGSDVYAQRYDSAGVPRGGEFRVNTFIPDTSSSSPAVSSDAAGNFVVVWMGPEGGNTGILGQRYSSSGVALGGEFRVNTYSRDQQGSSAVSSDAAGGFVVVWDSYRQDGGDSGIFGQRYSSGGEALGGEFRVNTYTTGGQYSPAVSSDAAGNFVVVWGSAYQDGSDIGVFGRRYSSSGAALDGEFRVNTTTTGHQGRPSVSSDADGNFVVAWDSYFQEQGQYSNGIFAQRYQSSGAALGGEFSVNTTITFNQRSPLVSSDADGDFAVVWIGADVFGRRFSSSGAALGGDFRVNTYTTGNQYSPAVSSDGAGDFVVVWNGNATGGGSLGGVFGQRFGVPTATPAATPTPTATPTLSPTATPTPTPLTLPGDSSVSQQLTVTERDRAVELTFQVVAPPIPGGCQVSVEVQPPTGQMQSFPMTTDEQVQTIDQPQPGVWTITARSGQECPGFSYYLFVRTVPVLSAMPLGLLFIVLGGSALGLRRNRKAGRMVRT